MKDQTDKLIYYPMLVSEIIATGAGHTNITGDASGTFPHPAGI